ncbi:MAG: hypothetical protein QG622_772 [Actinomycetota bacterium]|nr:hypothetical protein [Actinomycetota bacterium]
MTLRALPARSFVEPALIIVIGLALGIVDQASAEVSYVLRVPALVGALVLVGQGLNLLDHARRADAVKVTTLDPVSVVAAATPVVEPVGARPVNKGEDVVEPVPATGGTDTLAWLVLGLAVWLGLATLAYPGAPLSLILLSLLSAYLLFARGWRLMVLPRR